MFTRKVIAASLLGLALIMAGCGARDGVGADIPTEEPGITEPTIPTDPVATPPAQPTPPPMQPVTVEVGEKSRFGGILWLINKKIKATITVTNPNPAQTSATLTITFSKGGSSVETQTQTVDLGPGESKRIEVKSTKAADDVNAFVEDNSANPAPGTGAGSGLGMPTTGGSTGNMGGGTGNTGGLPY